LNTPPEKMQERDCESKNSTEEDDKELLDPAQDLDNDRHEFAHGLVHPKLEQLGIDERTRAEGRKVSLVDKVDTKKKSACFLPLFLSLFLLTHTK